MIILNRSARAEYTISETFEAGIVLAGLEVKSLRLGKANLKGSFIKIMGGEAFIHNMHIQPYPFARAEEYEPTRIRKLLLKKKELIKLAEYDQRKGVSIVPLKIYVAGRNLKVQIGIGKGKQQFERRAELKKRDQDRELRAQFKQAALR